MFSHLYCLNHQYKRNDTKYLDRKKMEKEKSLNPHARVNVMPLPIEKSFGYTNQMEMFLDLWHDRYVSGKGIICPFTGEKLDRFKGTSYFWSCFMHVLPKGRYTYWKLNPHNVIIAFPTFHRVADQGTLDERKEHPSWRWDEWDALVIDMKEQYRKFKIENHLA